MSATGKGGRPPGAHGDGEDLTATVQDRPFEEDEGNEDLTATVPDGPAPADILPPKNMAPYVDGGEIRFRYFGKTDVGLIREHNEDNFTVANLDSRLRDLPDEAIQTGALGPLGLLLAVCDGMGGAAAGEVASQMAVDTIYEVMQEAEPTNDRDTYARRLVHAIEEAGARIFSSAKMDRSRRGMGTTSTVAALFDKVLFLGQVGDSRAYVLRQGQIKLVTKDQSLVNQLIEAGQLTEEEAEAFEHSNIILQALGTTEDVSVDLTFLELRRGDRIMMCSDGLSGLVHADMMKEVLQETGDLRVAAARLIEMANAGGGHDNITVVVAEFDGTGLPPPDGVLPVYAQYPLPEEEKPAEASPSREPTRKVSAGASKPGADVKRAPAAVPAEVGSGGGEASEGGGFPWLLVAGALLVGAVLVALVLGLGLGGGGDDPQPGTPPSGRNAPPATPPEAAAEPVEVRVRSDVVDGELYVDGESYGLIRDGEEYIYLELSPGAYRFEARAGGSTVASANLTVRAGVPADVALMMPTGSGSSTDDDDADAGASEEDEAARQARRERRERRRLEAEAAAQEEADMRPRLVRDIDFGEPAPTMTDTSMTVSSMTPSGGADSAERPPDNPF